MISNRFPLAATLLAAGAFLFLPTPARADSEGETPQEAENSHVVELKLMARRLMERVEDHRERLTRLENLIRYHRARGQADEVRKLEALKQREVESFEQTLAEIHRLLGSQDFERVSKAVRYLNNQATHTEPGESQESAAVGASAREASAAIPQSVAGTERIEASIERTLDRQLMLERARASQRLQLAQRLKAARDQQLRLIAQQQRRFQPPAGANASTRERGANAGSRNAPGGRQQAMPYRRP